jgi:Ca2+-dependent lipid-binding protein
MEEKKVLFPKDVTQIPDLFFYLADEDEESRYQSFARIKASSIIDCVTKSVLQLKEDRSLNLIKDDEVAGFLSVEMSLYSTNPPEWTSISEEKVEETDYDLRVMIHVARDLPPSDATGSSDPYVKVRCASKHAVSRIQYKTLNPDFYETLSLKVSLQLLEKAKISQGMMIMMFDKDSEDSDDLLGRCWIQFDLKAMGSTNVQYFHRKPKWFNLFYDATEQVQGKILISYALIP